MRHLTLKALFFLSFAVLLGACKKDKSDPTPTFELYIEFWNPTGTDPQITFNEAKTSPEVKIDFNKQFEGVAEGMNLTKVLIDNLRIIDNSYNNYTISNITAYEYKPDVSDWRKDVEFTMSYENTNSLRLVMVIDRSESLGDDFTKVKEYAIQFVQKIFTDVVDVQIGIVDFSDNVNSLPLTNDQQSLENYINNLQPGKFTALYDAMNTAADMLIGITAESKSILTFTDGADNNSNVISSHTEIRDKLLNDLSDVKISSFTIGLNGDGNVEESILSGLFVNGGISQFLKSISELDKAFQNFSRAIANVYNLTYTRNQQKIAETSKAQLKFVIESHL